MLTFNEGKVYDAVIKYLETREGMIRAGLRSPEDEAHVSPVELAFTIGHQLFALEHTGIEPFEGHMQMEAESKRSARRSQTSYQLARCMSFKFPPRHFNGAKSETSRIQQAVIDWVKQTAPSVPIEHAEYVGNLQPSLPPGVPFPLKLYRFQSVVASGYFMIKHVLSGDLDYARRELIRIACEKKFPKLDKWKHNEGARTVLVLEDNDIQLTNQAIAAETFLPIAQARIDRPDGTYVVTTCMDHGTVGRS